jgi:Pyruvate kinase
VDLALGLQIGVDVVAMSYVQSSDDICALKAEMRQLGKTLPIIAKLERRGAIQNLQRILEEADGIMVARGDLGLECELSDIPAIQKRIINACNAAGKPVIVATQMLDSMIRNPRPTRAEASDVANAVLDGADAVMLSGETAKGAYPLRSVETMKRIVAGAESEIELWERPLHSTSKTMGVPDAVSSASVLVARQMKAAAIISMTQSGSTAQMVSKHRPPCPILGATPSVRTWRGARAFTGASYLS